MCIRDRVSSNRDTKNTTQDNIYAFTVNDLRFTLEGIAVEKSTQEPLAGVVVELTNKKTGKKELFTTGPDGKFFFKLNPETDYVVMGSCLLYTSDAADERSSVDLGGRRIIKKKNNKILLHARCVQ